MKLRIKMKQLTLQSRSPSFCPRPVAVLRKRTLWYLACKLCDIKLSSLPFLGKRKYKNHYYKYCIRLLKCIVFKTVSHMVKTDQENRLRLFKPSVLSCQLHLFPLSFTINILVFKKKCKDSNIFLKNSISCMLMKPLFLRVCLLLFVNKDI